MTPCQLYLCTIQSFDNLRSATAISIQAKPVVVSQTDATIRYLRGLGKFRISSASNKPLRIPIAGKTIAAQTVLTKKQRDLRLEVPQNGTCCLSQRQFGSAEIMALKSRLQAICAPIATPERLSTKGVSMKVNAHQELQNPVMD